uniref:Chorismate lyase n=1 Tax=Apoglossum ruscifolium TaxID=167976 RepID=A0A4D6WPU6_9FLOR|nr:hypothetical protein [Apoglossum ruscifolium]
MFYIDTFYKFHYIFIIPIKKIKFLKKKLYNIIPIKWQIILMNEGSLTEILHFLNNQNIQIKIFQENHAICIHNNTNRNIRCIWLKSSLCTNLIFAKSLWKFQYIDKIEYELQSNKPLGKSLIESQTDIYKEIHEIYYGYSEYLQCKFKTNHGIWGRKYTLYYKNKASITVQEFFSPDIINLCNK